MDSSISRDRNGGMCRRNMESIRYVDEDIEQAFEEMKCKADNFILPLL